MMVRASSVVAIPAAFLAYACSGLDRSTAPRPPRPPASLVIVAGGDQIGAAGSTLAVAVRALASDGLPVAGATIDWTADGFVSPTSSTTDSTGLATTGWHLPTTLGTYHLTAHADATTGVSTGATAQSIAGPPASVQIVEGDRQQVIVGRVAGYPLRVRVTDRYSNPVMGATVAWKADSGSLISNVQSATDSLGSISAQWTVPTIAGIAHVRVVAGDTVQAVFTATLIADAPATVGAVAGDGQNGPYGVTLVAPLIVRVRDKYGNPVQRATLSVHADSGAAVDSIVSTDSLGLTGTRLRLPMNYATVSVTFGTKGATPAILTARSGPAVFAQVSAGANKTCALTTEGYVYCWGENQDGLLGVNAAAGAYVTKPMPVLAATSAYSSVSTGTFEICAIDRNKTLWCWGDSRALPEAWGLPSGTPVPLAQSARFASVSTSLGTHCALDVTGVAFCWDGGNYGEAGQQPGHVSIAPTPISSDLRFTSLAAGNYHTCGVDNDGVVWCWGLNDVGQLGAAVSTSCSSGIAQVPCSWTPVRVPLDKQMVSVRASYQTTCALAADGTAYCWGSSNMGQLGGGSVTGSGPVQVSTTQRFTALNVSDYWACASNTTGQPWCWGTNLWVLGVNSPDSCQAAPSVVFPCATSPSGDWSAGSISGLSLGASGLCGFAIDGRLYCWGFNYHGEIGDGTLVTKAVPTLVLGQQ